MGSLDVKRGSNNLTRCRSLSTGAPSQAARRTALLFSIRKSVAQRSWEFILLHSNPGYQMQMSLVIPIMGGLHASKPFWGSLLNSVEGPVDLMVIDNAPLEDDGQQVSFLDQYIAPRWPGAVSYRPQQDNLGMFRSMQYAYEAGAHDILAYLHNDLFIYERGWDRRIVEIFTNEGRAGLSGFFGASVIHPGGDREGSRSNMLEAEIHGRRTTDGTYFECAVLDGMALIASREMLDVRSGFDLSYKVHHFYDLDLCLESIDRGFRNFVLPIPIHHQSGQTAHSPVFQKWADEHENATRAKTGTSGERVIYEKSRSRFMEKWGNRLPYRLEGGWNE